MISLLISGQQSFFSFKRGRSELYKVYPLMVKYFYIQNTEGQELPGYPRLKGTGADSGLQVGYPFLGSRWLGQKDDRIWSQYSGFESGSVTYYLWDLVPAIHTIPELTYTSCLIHEMKSVTSIMLRWRSVHKDSMSSWYGDSFRIHKPLADFFFLMAQWLKKNKNQIHKHEESP